MSDLRALADLSGLDDLTRELRRVADRLDSMPIARAESVVLQCHAVAELIVDQTRLLTDEIPADAVVPLVGVSALGSQLTVLGRDYRDAVVRARAVRVVDVAPVIDALIALRRSLP